MTPRKNCTGPAFVSPRVTLLCILCTAIRPSHVTSRGFLVQLQNVILFPLVSALLAVFFRG